MSYETMMYIGIGVSVVMFVLSIILFVQLNIPRVIGGLSGYSARKEIASIREQNEQSGKKGYQTSPVNRARGKITTPLGQKANSGRLAQMTADLTRVINKTQTLSPQQMQGAETTLLGASEQNATTVLGNNEANATILGAAEPNATTILGYNTAVITPQNIPELDANTEPQSFAFEIEVDLAVTHTNEIIQ